MPEARDKPRRVDVGFSGGQVLSLRMMESAYDSLRAALADEKSGRWHELATEDSRLSVDLAQVVYLRIDTEQHRVGF